MKAKFNKSVVLKVTMDFDEANDTVMTMDEPFLIEDPITFDILKNKKNEIEVQFGSGDIATIQKSDITITGFERASEVRQYLKDNGFPVKFKVRYMDSPFGGPGRFWVKPETKGSVISCGSSDRPGTQYSCSDRATADAYTKLQTLLKGTNASAD